tara:strand:- start:4104 stop:4562 length:459 start_codon:yes stop_codon:yes gene_type:complete
MVANITSPATVNFSGGSFRDTRVKPARLRFTGGQVTTLRDTPLSTQAEIPRLDRLTRWEKPEGFTPQGWERQMAIWQKQCEAIEAAFVAVNARVDEVALYARLNAVEALAEAANDNAVTAQATAATVSTAVSETFAQIDPTLGDSYTDRLEP